MVPPINDISVTPETAKELTDEEIAIVQTEAQRRLSVNLDDNTTLQSDEKKETGEITKEQLLNKPNMTAKDKEGMQKAIDFLVKKYMNTQENFKKLDDIIYTSEYIEIGGVKRARKDISAKPNGKNIFQHNNVTYFKRSENMIKEQNDLLAQQGMKIPLDSAYETSMRALPGEYSRGKRCNVGAILTLIIDMSMDGYCGRGGELKLWGKIGCCWSVSPVEANHFAHYFNFNEYNGIIDLFGRDYAIPIRPILK